MCMSFYVYGACYKQITSTLCVSTCTRVPPPKPLPHPHQITTTLYVSMRMRIRIRILLPATRVVCRHRNERADPARGLGQGPPSPPSYARLRPPAGDRDGDCPLAPLPAPPPGPKMGQKRSVSSAPADTMVSPSGLCVCIKWGWGRGWVGDGKHVIRNAPWPRESERERMSEGLYMGDPGRFTHNTHLGQERERERGRLRAYMGDPGRFTHTTHLGQVQHPRRVTAELLQLGHRGVLPQDQLARGMLDRG